MSMMSICECIHVCVYSFVSKRAASYSWYECVFWFFIGLTKAFYMCVYNLRYVKAKFALLHYSARWFCCRRCCYCRVCVFFISDSFSTINRTNVMCSLRIVFIMVSCSSHVCANKGVVYSK